jgi:hypothetical protein
MKKAFKWFFISLWLLSIFAITVLAIVSEAHDRSENIRILEQGAHSSGTVSSKIDDDSDSGKIVYTFSTPNDNLVTNRMDVHYELYKKLEVEGPLDIAYDPANPERNIPVEQGVKSVGGIVGEAFGIAFFAAEIGGFFWWLLYCLLRLLIKPGEHLYKKIKRGSTVGKMQATTAHSL